MDRVARVSGICLAVDTDTAMTAMRLAQMTPARYRGRPIAGIGRYVSFGSPGAGDITRAELDRILQANFGSWPIQHAPRVGWMPTEAMGTADGTHSAENALAAGYVPGTHLEIDLEGISDQASHAQVFDYVEATASAVLRHGAFDPLLYVGWRSVLTSQELWLLPSVHRYASDPGRHKVLHRGTVCEQVVLDVVLAKTSTLVDVVDCHADVLGGMLCWTISASVMAAAA